MIRFDAGCFGFVLFYCCCFFLSSCLFVVDFVQHFIMSCLKFMNQLAMDSHSPSVSAQYQTYMYLHKYTNERTTSYIKRFCLFLLLLCCCCFCLFSFCFFFFLGGGGGVLSTI